MKAAQNDKDAFLTAHAIKESQNDVRKRKNKLAISEAFKKLSKTFDLEEELEKNQEQKKKILKQIQSITKQEEKKQAVISDASKQVDLQIAQAYLKVNPSTYARKASDIMPGLARKAVIGKAKEPEKGK